MQLEQTLTKENFWNKIMELYPKAAKEFGEWIDEYKAAVSWLELFGDEVKFHHLPYEMQQGVWLEFIRQSLSRYFEQSEYKYSFDFREDVKTVFGEIEEFMEP